MQTHYVIIIHKMILKLRALGNSSLGNNEEKVAKHYLLLLLQASTGAFIDKTIWSMSAKSNLSAPTVGPDISTRLSSYPRMIEPSGCCQQHDPNDQSKHLYHVSCFSFLNTGDLH